MSKSLSNEKNRRKKAFFKKHSDYFVLQTGEGRKRSQLSLGNSSEYSLKVLETNVVDLVASIKLPSGAIEPCLLKKDSEGHLCKIFKKYLKKNFNQKNVIFIIVYQP